ncbi:MAG: hypothetical protein A2177_06670 [Spirochaetes bacterium RBG_13_68_11]|nr:MAG: hypothetical protein A2177_06670 [Spirochaetes bacterium RBG_13_68_11]
MGTATSGNIFNLVSGAALGALGFGTSGTTQKVGVSIVSVLNAVMGILGLTGGRKQMAKARRTTHRSSSGKKLYAVRDSKGRFKDIQTYKRAHRMDLKKKSKAEKAKKK